MTYENQTPTKKSGKRTDDVRQQVTDLILSQLEKGTVPWEKPWASDNAVNLELPRNATTTNSYKGINIILLWSANLANQFPTRDWATLKQWSYTQERIKQGEKGSPIVFYDTFDREKDGQVEKIPYLKKSIVFNRAQLESFQPNENKPPEVPLAQRIEKFDAFIANTKAVITYQGDKAFYRPSEDKIVMPDEASFIDTKQASATEGMYATLAHELTHWTGHPSRENRLIKNRFGEPDYASEELTAEFGSSFLAAEFGLATPEKEHHAAYIAGWMNVLKDNNKCLFTAASQASKAVDYLHSLQPQ